MIKTAKQFYSIDFINRNYSFGYCQSVLLPKIRRQFGKTRRQFLTAAEIAAFFDVKVEMISIK